MKKFFLACSLSIAVAAPVFSDIITISETLYSVSAQCDYVNHDLWPASEDVHESFAQTATEPLTGGVRGAGGTVNLFSLSVSATAERNGGITMANLTSQAQASSLISFTPNDDGIFMFTVSGLLDLEAYEDIIPIDQSFHFLFEDFTIGDTLINNCYSSSGEAVFDENWNVIYPPQTQSFEDRIALSMVQAHTYKATLSGHANAWGGFAIQSLHASIAIEKTAVPEPSSFALLGFGLFSLAAVGKRGRRIG